MKKKNEENDTEQDKNDTLSKEDLSKEENNLDEMNVSDSDNILELKQSLEEAIDQKQRALAEAENTRRRSSIDVEQSKKYGHISFARDLLEIYDNLERAIKSAPSKKEELSDEIKNFIVGIEMTLEQIKQVFNNNSITQIDPINEKFDYNFHQAMFENETDSVEPGTVIEVMQTGWMLHDRLLRPAMVGVSKKKIK